MEFQTKLSALADVIVRVPPLFMVDGLLRVGLPQGESNYYNPSFEVGNNDSNITERGLPPTIPDYTNAGLLYKVLEATVLKYIPPWLGIVTAMCVFMLSKKHLATLYIYLISVGIVFVSHWANVSMMETVIAAMTANETASGTGTQVYTSISEDLLSLNLARLVDPSGYSFTVILNYALQCMLAFIFAWVDLGPRHPVIQTLLPVGFMAPSILAVLPLSVSILHPTPEFAVWLLLPQVKLAVFYSVPAVVQTIYGGYQYAYNLVSNFGLSALVRTEMLRLNVHTVLRTFWLLRVAEHAASLLLNYLSVSEGQQTQHNLLLYTAVFNMTKSLLVSGCETSTAVLGMTITVSYICHYVGCFFQWILPTEDDADDDEEMAMTLTLLFYILALDSDLTQLDPEKRFISLCRNFCVLFIFLIQLVHRDMLNPLLISLRRSYNQSLHRHIRTLAVCTPLIVFPASLLAYLWSQHAISTWLLDVSALSIQAIVKVVVSLMIHSLFLVHAYRSSFWEKMDDYVYYIQAFGNTVEFCVYIFTSCNYAWIIYFESGRVLRLLMMFNDGYNAWNKAWDIWSEFMKRRTVVNKINSLPDANTEQLRRLDDTCAICQEEMKSAKLTPCNHLFHGACLRNWLYEHNDCPMCRASF